MVNVEAVGKSSFVNLLKGNKQAQMNKRRIFNRMCLEMGKNNMPFPT
jgi:hypothetical protein